MIVPILTLREFYEVREKRYAVMYGEVRIGKIYKSGHKWVLVFFLEEVERILHTKKVGEVEKVTYHSSRKNALGYAIDSLSRCME